jgi:predicted TIM-barrel fold metal-dependent hydrolase
MKFRFTLIILMVFTVSGRPDEGLQAEVIPGYEQRIRDFIDSLKIVDTHEHFYNPEFLRKTNLLDIGLLLQQNNYDDLISSGMPDTLFNYMFNMPLGGNEKWKLIEPYWKKTFNTMSSRIILIAIKDLYGINELNDSTSGILSSKIKLAYNGDWFNHVLKDICKFDYVIQEQDLLGKNNEYIHYTNLFSDWLTLKTKFRIDSLAVMQIEPIYTLENLVNSMRIAFVDAVKMGMVAVKIKVAYSRTLSFEKVSADAARKVFRTLTNGDENFELSYKDAKPLQDFMLYHLLEMARQYKLPVAFHTGLQAGNGNYIENSDPALLANLFLEYPEINFVIYHGSYPYGGILSTLAKTYKNVHLDMNWTYAISPTYAERYLNELLEAVPTSKIMAFGGDQKCVENTYGQLVIAKQIISDVLINKVRNEYLSEAEAKVIARMILHDNAVKFYNLR